MTETKTVSAELLQQIIDGCEGVTPGPWWSDSERSEGGSGSFDAYAVYGPERFGRPSSICDTHNAGEIALEQDDGRPWDEQGRKNMAHVGRLDPDTVKAMAELALSALASRHQEPVNEPAEWQEISTAPKDGSEIMLICATAYTPTAFEGWWDEGWKHYSRDGSHGEKFSGNGVTEWFPTHWRPKPEWLPLRAASIPKVEPSPSFPTVGEPVPAMPGEMDMLFAGLRRGASADNEMRLKRLEAIISSAQSSIQRAEALLGEYLAHNDEGPGLIDCIDNDGDRYTSQGLDNTVKATRSFLASLGEKPDAE